VLQVVTSPQLRILRRSQIYTFVQHEIQIPMYYDTTIDNVQACTIVLSISKRKRVLSNARHVVVEQFNSTAWPATVRAQASTDICGLLNDAVNSAHYTASNDLINEQLTGKNMKGTGRGLMGGSLLSQYSTWWD
jgi:hypothetical protein